MSNLRNFKENHKVNLQGARHHVILTIKNYSQMDKLVFHRQLDVTLRGLVVAGVTPYEGFVMICDELTKGGFEVYAWVNGRTTQEIIANYLPK